MYGQLLFHPDSADAPWQVSFYLRLDLEPPKLSAQDLTERSAALKQFSIEVPNLTPAEAGYLSKVCKGLPANHTDLVSDLFLGLAHLRLPAARRKEREDLISTTLGAYFLNMTLPPPIVAALNYIKLMAVLTPDAFLQEIVGAHTRHSARVEGYPQAPHYEFLADSIWSEYAYGRNAIYTWTSYNGAIHFITSHHDPA